MRKSLLRAATAAFLCLGLPAITGIGTLVALAQTNVSFTEWTVPTKGSHPHDPLAAPDGTIWYTGQMASVLGRLNPRTGAFREYKTKTPDSGPHGLAADQEGNIWLPAILLAISANWIPRRVRSVSIVCPMRLATLTRRCSIKREFFGSRCRART